jgi:hypothetical protein
MAKAEVDHLQTLRPGIITALEKPLGSKSLGIMPEHFRIPQQGYEVNVYLGASWDSFFTDNVSARRYLLWETEQQRRSYT